MPVGRDGKKIPYLPSDPRGRSMPGYPEKAMPGENSPGGYMPKPMQKGPSKKGTPGLIRRAPKA